MAVFGNSVWWKDHCKDVLQDSSMYKNTLLWYAHHDIVKISQVGAGNKRTWWAIQSGTSNDRITECILLVSLLVTRVFAKRPCTTAQQTAHQTCTCAAMHSTVCNCFESLEALLNLVVDTWHIITQPGMWPQETNVKYVAYKCYLRHQPKPDQICKLEACVLIKRHEDHISVTSANLAQPICGRDFEEFACMHSAKK